MKPYSYWEPDFGQEDVRQKDELTGRYSPLAQPRTLAEGQRHRSLGHRRHRPRNRANPDVGVTTDARAHPHWLTANLNMVRSLPNHGSSGARLPAAHSSTGLADEALFLGTHTDLPVLYGPDEAHRQHASSTSE